jgi:hypothetical protein
LHKPGPNSTSLGSSDPNPVQSFLSFDNHDGKPVQKTTEPDAAHKFVLVAGNFPMPQTPSGSSGTSIASTGAGAQWYVKGGTFQFQVNTDFALSDASVTPAPNSIYNPVILSVDSDQAVYSKPMRMTVPLKSALTVTVRKKSDNTIVDGWQSVAFVITAAPSAVWSIYSQLNDPIFNSNPQALLSPDQPTVALAMGIILSAPPPILALSLIPVFNATDAAKEAILDFRTDPNGTPWLLEKPENTQTEYLAADVGSQPGTLEQQWATMMNTWNGLASKSDIVNDPTQGVIAICTSLCNWSKRPQAETTSTPTTATGGGSASTTATPPATKQPWELGGNFPANLVNDLNDTYLDLPRMATVSS